MMPSRINLQKKKGSCIYLPRNRAETGTVGGLMWDNEALTSALVSRTIEFSIMAKQRLRNSARKSSNCADCKLKTNTKSIILFYIKKILDYYYIWNMEPNWPDLLFFLCELVILGSGGKVHKGNERGKGGNELEGDHRLSHVVAVDSWKEIYRYTCMSLNRSLNTVTVHVLARYPT